MSNSQNNKSLAELPAAPEYKVNLKSFAFWRDTFLIYWVFSFIGHLMEYVWLFTLAQFGAPEDPTRIPFFVIAAPYGLGALAILWFIYPQIQKRNLKIFDTFVLCAIVATVVEFLCAIAIILVLGSNPYWDYSDQPLNLLGQVCLRNSLAFGVASIGFIYIVYPYYDKLMKKLGSFRINSIFWFLFITYFLLQIGRFFYGDLALTV
jgi:Predicted membrane protein